MNQLLAQIRIILQAFEGSAHSTRIRLNADPHLTGLGTYWDEVNTLTAQLRVMLTRLESGRPAQDLPVFFLRPMERAARALNCPDEAHLLRIRTACADLQTACERVFAAESRYQPFLRQAS
ncbi:hypothetical protein [Deinococcus soli (ex Cha et al. 2016)]|uniref:Uncharacterized protein n=2 Tax=Deinococcus soli (ex Cha et al. 2016) TaxID=1309411 RepID=A0AAE3XC15_9DEIO|nr:hypothetical protein [Deinococcus soli (ex Cha et al. 2016)]MDR6218174.1 hypothetical protein [Deinococcus soli (ex Cha et al. 2016)]MDR6328914.1 hypothetical protein [Deinococcus soli (ex Cha et al. 2016)]MDR6751598.1 hypothetical protein [Deinococcus soli (ex Cha et al. 2016)]